MAVEIANRTKFRPSRPLIERAVACVLSFSKVKGEVSVVIVNDAAIKILNKQYRGKNKPTDILSFAEGDSELAMPGVIGELVVNYEQIARQAKTFGHSVLWELAFIVIHGTLHLVGYEDETEKGRVEMEKLGEKLIKKLKI